jgi:DnaJ-class molecular chaperone
MPLKDYYLLLNVKPGADVISIKRAFRKLAHTYHPDKTGLNSLNHDYYTELQEAYST